MAGRENHYRKVKLKQFPSATHESVEGQYWRKFKFPVLVQLYAPVTAVNFSPAAPYPFAVTSSTRVQIYSSSTHVVTKTLSRFKDVAYSGSFRADGKLLVAGGESSNILLFDLQSRAILRSFTSHQAPIHVTKFSNDNVQVFSASDDKTVRVWDIPAEKELQTLGGHEDYIRAGSVVPVGSSLFVTGSYDHTVRMWDTRVGQAVVKLDHLHPVEAVLPFSSASVILSAGANNELKVWDILGGGRLLHTVSNHQKAVTCLAFNATGDRVLSGSLDHHIKVYNVEDYSVVHSIKYNAPILSAALSPDDSHLVAGLSDGMLSIRHRIVRDRTAVVRKKHALKANNPRYFQRGKTEPPQQGDQLVKHQKKPKQQIYDTHIRKFQYKEALDAALATNNPVIVYSVISELFARRGFEIALMGRDEATLEPFLHFLITHITNPIYSTLLLDACNTLFDLYGNIVGQSVVLDELFFKLSTRIKTELAFQKQIYQLLGCLDMLISASAAKS